MAWTTTEIDWKGPNPAAYTAGERGEFQACLDARVALLEPECTQDLTVLARQWFRQRSRFFVLSDGVKRIWFLFMRRALPPGSAAPAAWRFLFSFNAESASDMTEVRQQIVGRLMRLRETVAAHIYWYPNGDATGEAAVFAAIQSLIDAHQDAQGKTVQKERRGNRDLYRFDPPDPPARPEPVEQPLVFEPPPFAGTFGGGELD